VTPYERVYREKPDLSGLPEWGQKVWVHNGTGSKLDGRAVEGRWVGFNKDSMHAHRIYWPHKNSITVERDVKFSPDVQKSTDSSASQPEGAAATTKQPGAQQATKVEPTSNAAPDSSLPPAPPTPNVRPSRIPKPSAYVKQIQSGKGTTEGRMRKGKPIGPDLPKGMQPQGESA
ncbi:hypothetical protein DENSPDRAFT_758247, partial [Dentipellis sp. KUC8613]